MWVHHVDFSNLGGLSPVLMLFLLLSSSAAFWGYVIICTLLVLGAGLMSGLTLGLLSLDLRELEILASVSSRTP